MTWEGLIGVLAAVLTGYLAGRWQERSQRLTETRLAIADLVRGAGIAAHTMTWFAWKAKHRPDIIAAKDAEDYDTAMSSIYTSLTGALAVVAAHDRLAYRLLKPLIDDIYELDEQVARTATGLLRREASAPAKVAAFYEQARGFEERVSAAGIGLIDKVRF